MPGIIELTIGIISTIFGAIFGGFMLIKTPKGYNFSTKAMIRWGIVTAFCVIIGIILIVLGYYNLTQN